MSVWKHQFNIRSYKLASNLPVLGNKTQEHLHFLHYVSYYAGDQMKRMKWAWNRARVFESRVL